MKQPLPRAVLLLPLNLANPLPFRGEILFSLFASVLGLFETAGDLITPLEISNRVGRIGKFELVLESGNIKRMLNLCPQLVYLLLPVDVEHPHNVAADRLSIAPSLVKTLGELVDLLLAKQAGLVNLREQGFEFLFASGLIKLVGDLDIAVFLCGSGLIKLVEDHDIAEFLQQRDPVGADADVLSHPLIGKTFSSDFKVVFFDFVPVLFHARSLRGKAL